MACRAKNIVAIFDKHGTCEQLIKEGKGAFKWTQLSCPCRQCSASSKACERGFWTNVIPRVPVHLSNMLNGYDVLLFQEPHPETTCDPVRFIAG
jgi:hypothetical protein